MASFFIWLLAVVSVAGIAWLAIGTAGRQVTADPISAPVPTEFPPTPEASGTTRPAATRTRSTTSPARPSPRGSTHAPSTGRVAHRASPRPRSTPVTSTYSTAAGRLRVRCEGRWITLDGGYAQPAPGWGVTVQSGGPDRIQVTFASDQTPPLSVVAVCGQGRPRFREETPQSPRPTGSGTARWRSGFASQSRPTPTEPPMPETTPAPCEPTPTVPAPLPSPSPSINSGVDGAPSLCPSASPTDPVVPSVTPTATAGPENSGRDWAQREWAQRERR
jgi:hypothetical protein